MKCFVVFLVCVLNTALLFAQNGNTSLLIQSPDGQTAKMIWFIKNWDPAITGFDVKRKEGNSGWVKLNNSPIQPAISRTKDLSVVVSDNAELTKLQAKLNTLINEKRLKEIDNATYLKKLSTDPNAIRDVAIMISFDYDVALINGFAYVDKVAGKKKYEYGVFSAGSDKPLATAIWSGEIPDLDIISQISSKKAGEKAQLMWQADTVKMKKEHVSGFFIYRNGQKLNQRPAMANSDKAMSSFTWFDSLASKTGVTKYSIIPVTLFGIEGKAQDYTHDPASFPPAYTAAEIKDIAAKSNGNKKGILLTWDFPEKDRRFVKGYYVERNTLPQGYEKISPLLPGYTAEFHDMGYPLPGTYIQYKITVVYNDGGIVSGTDKLFIYFPDTKPEAPKNLKATWSKENGKVFADLSWTGTNQDDQLTDYYQIYVSNPIDGKMYLDAGIGPIKGSSYRYELKYQKAVAYRFAISAVSKYKIEGPMSDTARLMAPSQALPLPMIAKLSLVDSNKVVIKWEYPSVPDLKGFRLYQNGNMVGSEFQLKREARQMQTPGLKWKSNYAFSIQAVSDNGVVSDVSIPVSILIYSETKK
jgi:hypothetical protein